MKASFKRSPGHGLGKQRHGVCAHERFVPGSGGAADATAISFLRRSYSSFLFGLGLIQKGRACLVQKAKIVVAVREPETTYSTT
jgi:hypothetical protein